MNYSDSFTRGVKAAQNLLERLGWHYDASCFAATAPPEMREEAGRVIFGPTEHEEERGFRWYLGYPQESKPEDWARSLRSWGIEGMAANDAAEGPGTYADSDLSNHSYRVSGITWQGTESGYEGHESFRTYEAARLEATRYMGSGDFQRVKIARNGETLFTMTLIKGSWV